MLCIVLYSFAQPALQWQKSYGGTYVEAANAIRPTSDGGYIVAAFTTSNDGDVTGFHGGDGNAGTGNSDGWVFKLDGSGNFSWGTCLGGLWIDNASDVRQTSDDGYVVFGNGNCGVCPYLFYLYKLDGSGNILWMKTYGGIQEYGASVRQTADGGYFMFGTSYSNSGDVTGHHGSTSKSDYWVVRTDTAGNLLWEKSYGGSENETAAAMYPTTDGGYILTGHSQSNDGDVTGHHGDTCSFYGYCNDIWLVKIDSLGTMQWEKSLGGTDDDEAADIIQTGDGGFILAGSVKSDDGDVSGIHPGPVVPTDDYWLVKLNESGDITWQKALGGTFDDQARTVAIASDGYVITGSALSMDGDISDPLGDFDIWLAKTDLDGNLQWEKSLGGSNYDSGNSILVTDDQSVVVAGGVFSTDGNITESFGSEDVWIFKTDPMSSGIEEASSGMRFSIYPNPAGKMIYVDDRGQQGGVLRIEDITGRECISEIIAPGNSTTSIDIAALKTGIYLVTLMRNDGSFQVQKLIRK